MYSFSACMTSKISQLTFGAHKFEECNGIVLNRLKIIPWSRAPISPARHQGTPIFPFLWILICPLHHQRAQMFHCAIQGPIFRFSPIRSFTPLLPQFPHSCIKGFQFPHYVIKGPQIFHCTIKGSQFPHHVIEMMTSNFPSHYQEVPIYHCVIKGPTVTSNFPLCYQGVPIYHCVIKGLHFPHRVIRGTQISKTHHVYNL